MKAAVLCVLAAAGVLCGGAQAAAVEAAAAAAEGRSFVGFLSGEAQAAYRAATLAGAGGRIIGGYEAIHGEVPWQCGLLITVPGSTGSGLCGGSLLSALSVLTAAHCWFDGVTTASSIQVVLGAHRINEFEEQSHRANTDHVVLHPDWQPSLIRNDIALAHLPEPVTFTPYIQPVALPSLEQLDETFAGQIGYASGWGITTNDGTNASPVLRRVSMNIIPNAVCAITSPILATPYNMCTSGLQGGAVCNGDSGGPLVVYHNAQPLLVGVTSFRHLFGCESIMPSMYARVTSFLPWILSEILS